MRTEIKVHRRLLSTVSLTLSRQEAQTVGLRTTEDGGLLIYFRSSDDDLEKMEKDFEVNAPAVGRYLSSVPGRSRTRKGEFYADYDEALGSWCVFHTDIRSGHAYSSYSSKEEAEEDAKRRNETFPVSFL